MTVSRISLIEYRGLAGDTKPTTYGGIAIPAFSSFLETDTRKLFYFDGASTWTEQVITGAGTSLHASTHLSGGSDPIAAATTSASGLVELATSGENAANVAVQGNDTRLSDARTPTAHAASHKSGADVLKSPIIFPFAWNTTGTTVTYLHVFNPFETGTAETNVDIIFDYAFQIKRFRVTMTQNAKTGTSVFYFRDDGVDVASVSVPTITLGEHDSGALSVDVAAGSKISFKVDASSGGVNNLKGSGYVIAEAQLV